jgi:hypothetical protein
LTTGVYASDKPLPSRIVILVFRVTMPVTGVHVATVCPVLAPMITPASHNGDSAMTTQAAMDKPELEEIEVKDNCRYG